MKTFSQILFHSQTANLWREAYFYHLVKSYLEDFCDCEYSQVLPVSRPIKIYIKRNKTKVIVQITSFNNSLLNDLRQKQHHLSQILHYYLVSKKIIQKDWQITIKIGNIL